MIYSSKKLYRKFYKLKKHKVKKELATLKYTLLIKSHKPYNLCDRFFIKKYEKKDVLIGKSI